MIALTVSNRATVHVVGRLLVEDDPTHLPFRMPVPWPYRLVARETKETVPEWFARTAHHRRQWPLG
jgi:hypothetical protein